MCQNSPLHSTAQEMKKTEGMQGTTMHPAVVSAFLFNMLLGSGVLTLPYAFQEGGVVLASVFLSITAFAAWVCANFVLEAISLCNYMDYTSVHDTSNSLTDDKPETSAYSIRTHYLCERAKNKISSPHR